MVFDALYSSFQNQIQRLFEEQNDDHCRVSCFQFLWHRLLFNRIHAFGTLAWPHRKISPAKTGSPCAFFGFFAQITRSSAVGGQ